MSRIPTRMDELPDSVADLPTMTQADVRALDQDIYYELFGSMHTSLAPAVIEIERIGRNKKIREKWERAQKVARHQEALGNRSLASSAIDTAQNYFSEQIPQGVKDYGDDYVDGLQQG